MSQSSALPSPPVAQKRAHSFTLHGKTLQDEYAWLKDPHYPTVDDPDILDYLKQENAFFEQAMKPRAALTGQLFSEMKARLQEDEQAVPWQDGDYLYWWSFQSGSQYRAWYRRLMADTEDKKQILIDEAAEAEGYDYFRLGALSISPDGRLAAWTCDNNGAERFTLQIRDLESGKDIETVSSVVNGAVVW